MFQSGECASGFAQKIKIYFSHGIAIAPRHHILNGSPGVHNHAVAIGFAAAYVIATLGRCDHVAYILYGSGLDQRLPMSLAGMGGEGSGQDCYLHAFVYQVAELLWEP
jgi:hypothetical protein